MLLNIIDKAEEALTYLFRKPGFLPPCVVCGGREFKKRVEMNPFSDSLDVRIRCPDCRTCYSTSISSMHLIAYSSEMALDYIVRCVRDSIRHPGPGAEEPVAQVEVSGSKCLKMGRKQAKWNI